MKSYALSRRNFLWSLGGATGLASWLDRAIAQEQGTMNPRRFVMLQRPVGTIYQHWWPQGTGTNLANYQFPRILAPLNAFKQDMVVFRGLGLPAGGSAGGGHERGTVLAVTGRRCPQLYPGNGGDDPYAEGPSVDQLFLNASPYLKDAPVQSIQVSCDQRADTPGEVSPRHLSYSGPRAPMRPYYQPLQTYDRIFGTLAPGGVDSGAARLQAEKKSVLDFALKDLARMRTLAPSAQWEKLDAYEQAVRELESELGNDATDPVFCGIDRRPENIQVNTRVDPYGGENIAAERDDIKHRNIGELHWAIIRAAFKCDLTRTVAFQWSPGTNHVSFADMWPPNPSTFKVHHTTSHKPSTTEVVEFLARIEVWYAQRLAEFITSLKQTTDITGKPIFDSTILAYITEVGAANHSWNNMPWALFAGRDTGIRGNQMWTHGGGQPSSATGANQRSTNDFWMALARPLGINNFVLGNDRTMYSEPISGLFS